MKQQRSYDTEQNTPTLGQAYQFCQKLAKSHYENFPVASLLLPKQLRRPICVVYAFARRADDFADEGTLSAAERLHLLDSYGAALHAVAKQTYQGNDPVFIALADVIEQYQLPVNLLDDLLTAFRQDVVKNRYHTFADVLDYCRYSANPVGRLMLHLNGRPSAEQLRQSDAVCTALQLINFYQDTLQDYLEQNRVYIPLDMLASAQLDVSDLSTENSQQCAPILRDLYQKTQTIMQSGVELGNQLDGRLGWEIRAMTLGGVMILNKLTSQSDSDLFSRPRLSRIEHLLILARSLSKTTLSATMPELTDSRNG